MANFISEMPISSIFKRFKLTRRTYTALPENMNSIITCIISLPYKKDVLALPKQTRLKLHHLINKACPVQLVYLLV